jgi:hypothetical protein
MGSNAALVSRTQSLYLHLQPIQASVDNAHTRWTVSYPPSAHPFTTQLLPNSGDGQYGQVLLGGINASEGSPDPVAKCSQFNVSPGLCPPRCDFAIKRILQDDANFNGQVLLGGINASEGSPDPVAAGVLRCLSGNPALRDRLQGLWLTAYKLRASQEAGDGESPNGACDGTKSV